MSDPFDVDVVIIGAGFSGLTVATELRRDGISFVNNRSAHGHLDEEGQVPARPGACHRR